jgi:PEP-CTERM motif
MRCTILMLGAVGVLLAGSCCPADAGQFTTTTVATQTIYSPAFGPNPVTITATGTQFWDINTATGVGSVTSTLIGNDLPNFFGVGPAFLSYDLYNTTTAGTVTSLGGGLYKAEFDVLFALTILNGPVPGFTFFTQDLATFIAPSTPVPFVAGTVFSDPSLGVGLFGPNSSDAVKIYAPDGSLAGYSYDRTVTITGVTPEPASFTIFGIGIAGMAGYGWRQRKTTAA